MPGLHHVEIWVADLPSARTEWGWLLGELGYTRTSAWNEGESWSAGGAYLTLTTSPNIAGEAHDRRLPGLNHLAFDGGARSDVDRILAAGPEHGWSQLYSDRYPHAGGPDHYAGWLENTAGFKVEVVATGI
ncbi:catechol 2,3-dioxygenase-like lactoylglutathione lyase family enzyme [Microbacterium terrae]|uniref:VOC domain-containing protein n=1 Tax=Microbacterium terrae TaxID=69369 RepID=A0A0M2H3P3_9MICO|nr:VOC family protein [Microbacterium terrae]KJL38425.1 hypothetical protein RS81_02696 [Microbacterium terrae]MBP1078932.1 catechol 2,3-dioxygenase-like lactoylglutathione lyase family enzyme [Microbacterium terrae]GLJ98332.1 hypothetical protein GCM10017594_15290 [Microbacterium terrae]